jgi:hypothetical protein
VAVNLGGTEASSGSITCIPDTATRVTQLLQACFKVSWVSVLDSTILEVGEGILSGGLWGHGCKQRFNDLT